MEVSIPSFMYFDNIQQNEVFTDIMLLKNFHIIRKIKFKSFQNQSIILIHSKLFDVQPCLHCTFLFFFVPLEALTSDNFPVKTKNIFLVETFLAGKKVGVPTAKIFLLHFFFKL